MKIILYIWCLIIFIITIGICSVKPTLHKTLLVYNSDYKIVQENKIEAETEIIPIIEKPVIEQSVAKKTETTTIPEIKKTEKTVVKVSKPQTGTAQKVTKTNTIKVQPKVQQSTVKSTTTPIQKEVKSDTVPSVITQPSVTVTQQPNTQKTILTEKEELIAWNVWRSNLMNKIMKDSKLPYIPQGTIFKFTFTVDKYGKVYNVQTWAEPSNYTPYAIQYIAPVIRNCQGHSILNFPDGTARTSTEVKGGWKISDNELLSNPNDYNDIEKVKR